MVYVCGCSSNPPVTVFYPAWRSPHQGKSGWEAFHRTHQKSKYYASSGETQCAPTAEKQVLRKWRDREDMRGNMVSERRVDREEKSKREQIA